MAILQDITDLRFLDEIKSNLLATVSHELKTPAVSIRLSLGMLKDESFGALTEMQRQLVDTSQREIERLIRNLATLLDITRFEEGRAKLNYSTINPEQLSQIVVVETRHAAQEANVEVKTLLRTGTADIRIDRDRMVIVITNLVLNAIKYSPSHETVELIFEQDDRHLTVIVKDRGPGIPEAYRGRIFDRFFRVPGQNAKSGTGLGLSIVQSFVDAHHGEVTVSDNQPKGAIFTLRIPVTPTNLTNNAQPDA